MPIPFYDRRVGTPGNLRLVRPQPRAVPAPSQSGQGLAAIGDALTAIGQVVGDSVARASDSVARVARAEARVKQAGILSQLRLDSERLLSDSRTNAGTDLEGFTPGIARDFDKRVDELLKDELPSVRADPAFREQIISFRGDVLSKSLSFEANQRVKLRTLAVADSISRTASAVELDPGSYQQAYAQQSAFINDAGLDPATQADLNRQLAQSITAAAAQGYARRDPVGTLARIADPKDALFASLPLEVRERAERAAKGQLVDMEAARIIGVYQSQGTDAGVQALGSIERSGLDASLQDEVRAKVNGAVSRLREQRRQENVDSITDLERSIANDSAGEAALYAADALYQRGALSASELANYSAQIEAGSVRRVRSEAAARELTDAINSGLPLDPRNTDQRKALSSAFANDTRNEAIGSPAWLAAASAYAARTRILPEQAIGYIRQTTRSPDPRIAAAGAQFFGSIAAQTPDALGEVDDTTKAFAGTVNAMLEAGTDPTRAVETARANVFDIKREVLEQRREQYRQLAKASDSALDSYIDRDFDPSIFTAQPAASAALKADFSAQASRYYTKTGDITIARDLAWQDLKRIYGPSRVNGDAIVVPFPVERFGVTPDDVRADIKAFLQAHPQADGSKPDEVYVVPDAMTMRQVTDALDGRAVQPSYKLIGKSGDLVLDANGVPKRYTLPSGEELGKRFKEAQERAEAEAQEKIRRTRSAREIRRQLLLQGVGGGI